MDNPFKKRATEYIADAQGLLSVTSPEPLRLFFDKDAGDQFDRLVIVVGTPGSGKTTMARLFEFDTLVTLSRSDYNRDYRQLASVLHDKGVLTDRVPAFLGFRFASGSSLRELWELPYQESVRHSLLRSFIQARTALGWIRKIERSEIDVSKVKLVRREDAESQAKLLRLDDVVAFRDHARAVEEEIFKIITSLVPPREEDLTSQPLSVRYDLFDALEAIQVPNIPGVTEQAVTLQPMLILDDAHELHASQFADIDLWLRNRDIKIARWVMTRVDAIGHTEFRKALADELKPSRAGTTPRRDRLIKPMQRESTRVKFRPVARDVSKRYFSQMPIFVRRGIENLDKCLREEAPTLSTAQLRDLNIQVKALESESGLPVGSLRALKAQIPDSLKPDVSSAIYRILLQREIKNRAQGDMFSLEDDSPQEEEGTENEPIEIRKSAWTSRLVQGAEIQLLHDFERPFYFGFDRLADCSTANIEQFIGLAGALVEQVEAKIIRGKEPTLDPREQHRVLLAHARDAIKQWDFPRSELVKRVVNFIAAKCVTRTTEPNAPLTQGANAFGIPQAEMDRIAEAGAELVPVLHYALAYNALSIHENYECKKRKWCLFELGGLPIIANGLPLNKGGFVEGKLSELVEATRS
jgi:hypothetical protein